MVPWQRGDGARENAILRNFLEASSDGRPRRHEEPLNTARSAVRKRAVFDARRRRNTVNGPSPFRVSTRSAAVSAASNVENSGSEEITISGIVCADAAEMLAARTRRMERLS